MKQKNLERILDFIREQMMTGNPPGGQGGFGSDPEKKGVAGYDPVMGKVRKRKKKQYWSGGHGARKHWMKKGES
tara:strand:+ start:2224 stop:2445 length:222 start_codon:yes stop_codon:yes gene_type:complete